MNASERPDLNKSHDSPASRPPRDPYGFIGQRVSHYEVQSVIGVGGMGVVYRAEDVRLKRSVALKFLPPEWTDDEHAKRRFFREAQAASALNHINILTIHDVGEAQGLPFISMAICRGETLAERLKRGSMSRDEALGVAVQIASGLAEAHRSGVIHRDLKPSNVMLGVDGVVKILDFGLARFVNDTSTGTGRIAGTPLYMSPEQLRGEVLDHRTDIWSFGILLFEMLAGRAPFHGTFHHAAIYSVLHEAPDLTGIPADCAEMVERMLEKVADRRISSAESVREELEAFRHQKRTATKPRTYRPIILGAAAAAVVLVGFLILLRPAWLAESIDVAPEDVVLVADFENRTGDEVLDHSVAEAFRVTLRQSRHVNLLSPDRIAGALERMNLAPAHRLNDSIAVDMARREGVRAVIGGYVDRFGSAYVLSSRIIDAGTGEIVRIRRAEAARIEDVMAAVDELAATMRRDLGESMEDISLASAPLSRVTTSSLEALEMYSKAASHYMAGEIDDAIRTTEAAVEIDSNFAEAVGTLARLYRRTGRNDEALRYHRRIPDLLDRVTARERFMLLADYYGPQFEMNYEEAVENARRWVAVYPGDALAYATLGHLMMFTGETASALTYNQRAIEFEPAFTAVVLGNSGFAQALAGNAAEALSLFRSSKRYRTEYRGLDGYIAQTFWMESQLDSAELTFRAILPQADELRRMKTYAHLAALSCFRGRLREAVTEAEAGLAASRTSGREADEAYFHILLAESARRRSDQAQFAGSMREAVRLAKSPYVDLALAGAGLAEMGFIDDAQVALSYLKAADSDDPFFVRRRVDMERFIEGSIAARRGSVKEAEALFEGISEIYRGDPIFLLSRSMLARVRDNRDATVADLEFLLRRRGEAVMAFLPSVRDGGIWTSRLWPEIHADLGEIYFESGEIEAAQSHLIAARDLWAGADGDFTRAVDVREMLVRLQTATPPSSN